ncbi:MAG: M20/M25/M40 family metallo-hydrolase, partial [Phycisphaerales bacterium]|nr:M20/M25/M40 family metallo-hydrolase [Phycisphaerales bacterium]
RRARKGSTTAHKIPGLKISGEVKIKTVPDQSCNVAAVLPGRGKLAGETIVVGAHWDHVGRMGATKGPHFPGADDNASGSSGVLTLAKRLVERAKKDNSKNRRTVVIAFFGAEEMGLWGSRHMAGNLKELGRHANVVAMINLDMIGRLRDNNVSLWGVDLGGQWAKLIRASSKNSGLKLRLYGPGFGLSDHASFHRCKIPVANFSTGLHPDTHQRSDTADKINSTGAIRILNVADKLLETLATRTEAIPYDGPK